MCFCVEEKINNSLQHQQLHTHTHTHVNCMSHQHIHNSFLSSNQNAFFILGNKMKRVCVGGQNKGGGQVYPSAGVVFIYGVKTRPRVGIGPQKGSHRHAVAQLWGSFRVRAVGALAQRLGQLPLLHRRADALLSGCVAAVQP